MITRRDFLRSAGGVTLLALHPIRHSLSVFDVDGPRQTMTQIDEAGAEIDRFVVTKAPRSLAAQQQL
jgi:hypothetical protein